MFVNKPQPCKKILERFFALHTKDGRTVFPFCFARVIDKTSWTHVAAARKTFLYRTARHLRIIHNFHPWQCMAHVEFLSLNAVILRSLPSLECTCVIGRSLCGCTTSVSTSLGPPCRRNVTSCKRRTSKGAGALAFIATFGILGIVTCSVGSGLVLLAAQLDVKKSKRDSTTKKQVGNEYNMPRQRRRRRVSPAPRDKLLEDGWSVKVEHTPGWLPTLERGCLHGKCERSEDAGTWQCLLQSIPTRREKKSLCWYRTGTVACRVGSASCVS